MFAKCRVSSLFNRKSQQSNLISCRNERVHYNRGNKNRLLHAYQRSEIYLNVKHSQRMSYPKNIYIYISISYFGSSTLANNKVLQRSIQVIERLINLSGNRNIMRYAKFSVPNKQYNFMFDLVWQLICVWLQYYESL